MTHLYIFINAKFLINKLNFEKKDWRQTDPFMELMYIMKKLNLLDQIVSNIKLKGLHHQIAKISTMNLEIGSSVQLFFVSKIKDFLKSLILLLNKYCKIVNHMQYYF